MSFQIAKLKHPNSCLSYGMKRRMFCNWKATPLIRKRKDAILEYKRWLDWNKYEY